MNKLLHYRYTWIVIIGMVSAALLAGELVNGRLWMHDLEVYYRTAARFVNGEELYRLAADGHYVYKYAPTAALYFTPFLLLPFSLAKAVYWALLTCLTIAAFHYFYSTLIPSADGYAGIRKKNVVLMLAFLAISVHLHREWHLGQVNLLLLVIYIVLVVGLVRHRPFYAGFMLAMSLFFKPFGLIFFPYLLLKKRFRTVLYAISFAVVLGLLPFLFYPSVPEFKNLYLSWFQELFIELKAKQSLLAGGNHTIFSVVARFTPLQHLLYSAAAIKLFQLVLLGFIGSLFLLFLEWGRHVAQRTVPEVSFLIALIPLFAFTSENAFLFTTPCIIYLLYHYQQFSLTGRVTLILACVLIGGNIRDLAGKDLYEYLHGLSVYSFGTLLLLIQLFVLLYKQKELSTQMRNKGEAINA